MKPTTLVMSSVSLVLYILASLVHVLAGITHNKDFVMSFNQLALLTLGFVVGTLKWVMKGIPKE